MNEVKTTLSRKEAAVNVRIRNLQHQMYRQRNRIKRMHQSTKKLEQQNTVFLEGLKNLARREAIREKLC